MPWAKFRQLVGSMHLLLQPSFTESFNVVTADGVHQGVPSVVSDAIDWAPARWQANPDDAEDLVRVAQYLLKTPQAVDDGQAGARQLRGAGSPDLEQLPESAGGRLVVETTPTLAPGLPLGGRAFLRGIRRTSIRRDRAPPSRARAPNRHRHRRSCLRGSRARERSPRRVQSMERGIAGAVNLLHLRGPAGGGFCGVVWVGCTAGQSRRQASGSALPL